MNRVLIIDDEKSIRFTLCAFLSAEGFIADAACDAETALRMMRENEYDAVVTDIIMPKLSGIDLLSKIRGISDTVQVIIMTGEPSVDTAVQAVQYGAADYLTKPIQKEVFFKTVRNALRIKKLSDEKAVLEEENQKHQQMLEKLVDRRTKSLQDMMQGIIYLLSSVVEVRDPYTAGHQRKVGNLSYEIAKIMNVHSDCMRYVRLIGYIHDIGKICVPAEILSKPGKLSSLEMDIIKTHAYKGFEMLSRVSLPPVIGETVCQHHERFDGSGYPRGLRDDEITQEAKIIIVADVVEAMVSHRPYRAALGIDAALSEIEEKSGVLYNPEVVSACIDLFKNSSFSLDDEEHDIDFPIWES